MFIFLSTQYPHQCQPHGCLQVAGVRTWPLGSGNQSEVCLSHSEPTETQALAISSPVELSGLTLLKIEIPATLPREHTVETVESQWQRLLLRKELGSDPGSYSPPWRMAGEQGCTQGGSSCGDEGTSQLHGSPSPHILVSHLNIAVVQIHSPNPKANILRPSLSHGSSY